MRRNLKLVAVAWMVLAAISMLLHKIVFSGGGHSPPRRGGWNLALDKLNFELFINLEVFGIDKRREVL